MYLPIILDLDEPTGTTSRDKTPMTATFLTQGGSNTAGTTFNTASVTPTAGRLIIFVESHIGGSGVDPTGIAGAGCVFTKLMTGPMEATWGGSSLWYACDTAPSAGAITITFAASHSGCRWSLAEFECDCDPADNGRSAILQAAIGQFNGITPLTTHIANASNFLNNEHGTIFINVRNQVAAVTQTPGSGLTELSDTSFNLTVDGRNFHMAFNWADVGIVDSRYTNNNSGTYGGSYFLEIKTPSAGPAAYNMVAGVGTYTLAGSAAGLKWAHKLAAGTATYTYTGATAGLKWGHKVAAASASYTIAGQPAVLRATRKLAAAVGTYVLTGSAAGMRKGRFMTAGTAAYTLTGFAAALRRMSRLVAGVGSYTFAYQPAGLKVAKKMAAGSAAYVLSGQTAGLRKSYRMAAGVGAYTIAGSAAALKRARKLVAGSGAYVLTGFPAGLEASGLRLVADDGSYTLTGFPATLYRGRRLIANTGTYTFSYQPVGLRHATRLSAQSGSYAYTGSDATLTKTERDHHMELIAEPGAYIFERLQATDLISTTPVYQRIKYARSRRLGTG